VNRQDSSLPLPRGTSGLSLLILGALSALVGGLIGLAMFAVMVWLCRHSWVVDSAESHGISEQHSSRLGGVAIFLGYLAFIFGAGQALGVYDERGWWVSSKLNLTTSSFAVPVILIALVGLWDDFAHHLKPALRLLLVGLLSCAALYANPDFMPASAYSWLPEALNQPLILLVAGSLLVTGFVNAGNMADGANGLLGGVIIIFLLVANWYQGDFHLQALVMALVVFLLFNLATGRIFLGDFGSYGLSSLVAFLALDLYARGDFTLWFLGAMLAYPCVEMMRVVTSRLARHESPFSAGNDHMHNYAYECLVQRGMQNITANSLTGIGIALISAGMPAFLVTSGAVPTPSTDFWFAYFIAYLVVHVFVAQWLQRCVEEK